MGHRPEATFFFGVEIVDFWDWSSDDQPDDMPYDYEWEQRLADKLGIVQGEDENSIDFHNRVKREANVSVIEAGDDNHDTFTIGITETVVNTDWDGQELIADDGPAAHPVFRWKPATSEYFQMVDGWLAQLQTFCDAMLNKKVDVKQLYDDGKVTWRLAAYYPSD